MDPADFVGVAYDAWISNAIAVSAITVWVCDYATVIADEVELVWFSPWSYIKVCFVLARVTLPLLVIVGSWYKYGPFTSDGVCAVAFDASSAVGIFNAVLTEAILYFYLYAFALKQRAVGIFLVLQYISVVVAVSVLQVVMSKEIAPILAQPDLGPYGMACTPSHGLSDGHTIAFFVVSVVPQSCLVFLTIWSMFTRYKGLKSSIVGAFLRDGLIFTYGMIFLSIGTVVISLKGPETPIKSVLNLPKAVFQNILATRLIIHLRKAASRHLEYRTAVSHLGSSLQFVAYESLMDPPTLSLDPSLHEVIQVPVLSSQSSHHRGRSDHLRPAIGHPYQHNSSQLSPLPEEQDLGSPREDCHLGRGHSWHAPASWQRPPTIYMDGPTSPTRPPSIPRLPANNRRPTFSSSTGTGARLTKKSSVNGPTSFLVL